MSSPPIAGRYLLYKDGTARFVRWLVAAALRCKGATKDQPPEHVTTKDLVTFAESIATAKQSVDIPASILELLNEVIIGRQICGEWYSQSSAMSETNRPAKSDLTHRYFIDVLRYIHDTLKSTRKSQKQGKTALPRFIATPDRPKSQAELSLSNLFAQLDVEEPVPEPLGDSLNAPKKVKKEPQSEDGGLPDGCATTLLQLDTNEEKRFALWCFLQDMREIRDYIRELWQRFREKQVSFLTASLATETAFGIMRRAETDLATSYPEFSGYDEVSKFLNEDDAECATASSGARTSLAVAEMTCTQSARTLDLIRTMWNEKPLGDYRCEAVFVNPLSPNTRYLTPLDSINVAKNKRLEAEVPVLRGGEQNCPEPRSARPCYSGSRLAKTLVNALPGIKKLVDHRTCLELGTRSAFLRTFCQVQLTAKRPVWLVMACQIYEELLEAVGNDGVRGWERLREERARLQSIERDFFEFHKDYGHGAALREGLMARLEEAKNAELTLVELATCDASSDNPSGNISPADQPVKSEDADSDSEKPSGENNADYIAVIEGLPAEAGTLLYYQIASHHGYAADILNDGFIMLAIVHLYKAMHHYGVLDSTWADMEWFLQVQSRERPLVAELGPDLDGMALWKRFEVASGLTVYLATLRKPGKWARGGAWKKSQAKANVFASGTKYYRGMLERGKVDIDLGFSRGEPADVVLRQIHDERNAASVTSTKRGRASSGPAQITGLHLLRTFTDTIITDEPELNFDYLTFSTQCAKLLISILAKVGPLLPPSLAKTISPYPPSIVSSLLLDSMKRTRSPGALEGSAIEAGASVLQDYIVELGDKFTTQALGRSSGHLQQVPDPLLADCADADSTSPRIGSAEQSIESAVLNEDSRVDANISESLGTQVEHENPPAEPGMPTDIREVYAARKKARGRRLLRTRKRSRGRSRFGGVEASTYHSFGT